MVVRRMSRLQAPADTVWAAVKRPETLVHVTRGFMSFDGPVPTSWAPGEPIVTHPRMFGRIPMSAHTIVVTAVDDERRELRTEEHGGVVRSWRHRIAVVPDGPDACHYSDAIDIDAGVATPAVAAWAHAFYRWRHRRWRPYARELAR